MTAPQGGTDAPVLDAKYFLKLIGLGAAIGIPAALLAALFLAVVNEVEDWLWTDLPDALCHDTPPWFLVVLLPVAGAVLVVVARRLLPGDGGHKPLLGIGGDPMPWTYGASIALAAIGTLAFGAVLGPEAPLIGLGSVVGMAVVAWRKPDDPIAAKTLGTAGSFSAVSALFGGPLVAGVLLLEAGLGAGAALLPGLIPGLVAASIGYVMFEGLGTWGGLHETGLNIPGLPHYDETSIRDLALAIVVGLVAAVVTAGIRRLARRVDGLAERWMVGVLLGGALVVGGLAQLATAFDADPQDVLFSGQDGLAALLTTGSTKIIVVLLVLKGLAYSVSLGSGFRGGPVFPAIFLGVGIAMLAVVWWDLSPTWAVAVGAAAGMTAGTRLLFSALVLSTLLVGTAGVDAISCAVLASVTAWLVMRALEPDPVAAAAVPAAPAPPPEGAPAQAG